MGLVLKNTLLLAFTCLSVLAKYSTVVAQDAELFQVQQLTFPHATSSSVYITWLEPLMSTSIASYLLDYTLVEAATNNQVPLSATATDYTVQGIAVPGTSVQIVVYSVLINGTRVPSSTYTGYTVPNSIATLQATSRTYYSLTVEFTPPSGYYDKYRVVCSSPDLDDAVLFNETIDAAGATDATCDGLVPGTYFQMNVSALRGERSSTEVSVMSWTLQQPIDLTVVNGNDLIRVSWDSSLEYEIFDAFTISYKYTSSQASFFYANESNPNPNCASLNVPHAVVYVMENLTTALDIVGVCPMSTYQIVSTLTRVNFDDAVYNITTRTAYENVDCTQVAIESLGALNTFTWQPPRSNVDKYLVTLTPKSSEGDASHKAAAVYNATFSSKETSFQLSNLSYNTDYDFTIRVKRVAFTSQPCTQTVTTGPPCPAYDSDNPLIKVKAPYPSTVLVAFVQETFSDAEQIQNFTIYVGKGVDCSSTKYVHGGTCYRTHFMNASEISDTQITFYDEDTEKDYIYYRFQLSTQNDCTSSQSICNILFSYDQDYYVTLEGVSKCGYVYSDSLLINIPTPFPLGTVIGVILGLVLSLIVILLVAIIVLAFFHIKKKHLQEAALSEHLIIEKNEPSTASEQRPPVIAVPLAVETQSIAL